MENWSFDTESKSGVLVIKGDMTINHVSDLKKSLVEAFESADQVTVDVSATESVDVAGLQLLCASHRFCCARGKTMCLKIDGNQGFVDFLEEVGFAQDFFCTHAETGECIWSGLN
jgi:ABC-type transporter Mla MlaB component